VSEGAVVILAVLALVVAVAIGAVLVVSSVLP